MLPDEENTSPTRPAVIAICCAVGVVLLGLLHWQRDLPVPGVWIIVGVLSFVGLFNLVGKTDIQFEINKRRYYVERKYGDESVLYSSWRLQSAIDTAVALFDGLADHLSAHPEQIAAIVETYQINVNLPPRAALKPNKLVYGIRRQMIRDRAIARWTSAHPEYSVGNSNYTIDPAEQTGLFHFFLSRTSDD